MNYNTILKFSMLILVFGCSVQSSKSEKSTEEPSTELTETVSQPVDSETTQPQMDFDAFNGNWCDNSSYEETGEYFNLEIQLNSTGNGEATFSTGGPFEESYSCKINQEGKLDLIWESVGGSMSFNEQNKQQTCQKKTATCTLDSKNNLSVTVFKNDCAYLNRSATLSRLPANESCW